MGREIMMVMMLWVYFFSHLFQQLSLVQIFLLVNLQAREKHEGQNSKVCSGGVTSPDLASGGRRGGGGGGRGKG